MVRKGHRKSRLGCNECKIRRVKCDESRPRCQRCHVSSRACSYEITSSGKTFEVQARPSYPQDHNPGQAATSSVSIISKSPDSQGRHHHAATTTASSLPVGHITSEINIEHLRLLENDENKTCQTVARTDEEIDVFRRLMVQRALHCPFLLHAIFALSSLHLSLQDQTKSSSYRDAAAVWQSRALRDFYTIFPDMIDEFNVLDVLLFQHVIGQHVFCDVFMATEDDFSTFVERLCSCLRLLRGTNTVIRSWWDSLCQTEIGLIILTSHLHQHSAPHPSQHECAALMDLVADADLGAKSVDVCQSALTQLQAYIDAENALNGASSKSTNMLFAWLITLSSEYVGLLEKHKPEALIILAHYAVLLHWRRRSWVVADAGKQLFQRISNYLGKGWDDWLEWPRSVIMSSTMATTTPNEC